MVRAFRDHGAAGVVGVKLGGEGCVLDDGRNSVHVPAFPVQRVVDTTGAGDSFLAGIIAAHLHGMDLERMARFANAVGSCCVQALGASTGIRSFEETIQLI
jgi:sugar/nucleoside kinase (ribokinase family)